MGLARRLAYPLLLHPAVERLARSHTDLEARVYAKASRYVGGRTVDEVLETIDHLLAEGFAVSIDAFGESQVDPDAIERTVIAYEHAGRRLRPRDDGTVDLEVVPSNLGIDRSVADFVESASHVARALPPGARLQVSAEEHRRTPSILAGAIQLARDGVPVVTTVQANLRRSPQDVDELIDAGVGIRMVKGAYVEDHEVALPWGEATDRAFAMLVHRARARGHEPSLATHDRVLVDALLGGRGPAEVEMLLGVRSDDAQALRSLGHRVRIYVPYGEEWFRYWMRRMVESLGA